MLPKPVILVAATSLTAGLIPPFVTMHIHANFNYHRQQAVLVSSV